MTVSTRIADPADAEPLLRAYWAYIAELYPPDICYNYDLDELRGEGVAFFVAEQDGEPLGCVAFVDKGNGEGELKSMYVAESARGRTARLRSHSARDGRCSDRRPTSLRPPRVLPPRAVWLLPGPRAPRLHGEAPGARRRLAGHPPTE